MPKSKGVSTKQIDTIRTYSRKGYSANRIQRKLTARHMGMRRTKLLTYVREFKRQPPRRHVERYAPRKYRKIYREAYAGKQIAEYGSVHGESRRIQISGSGSQLHEAMQLVIKYAPRERFLTINAQTLLSNPRKYLRGEWDARPEVKS